jgi:hypothetical protein
MKIEYVMELVDTDNNPYSVPAKVRYDFIAKHTTKEQLNAMEAVLEKRTVRQMETLAMGEHTQQQRLLKKYPELGLVYSFLSFYFDHAAGDSWDGVPTKASEM